MGMSSGRVSLTWWFAGISVFRLIEPIAKCWLCNRRCLIEACAGLFFWVSAAKSLFSRFFALF